MKNILLLLLTFSVLSSIAFAQLEQDSEETSWPIKTIDFDFYKSLVSKKNCLASARNYLGCVFSLQALLESIDPSLQIKIYSADLNTQSKIEFDAKVLRIIKDYKQTTSPITSIKDYYMSIQEKKNIFIREFTKAYLQEQKATQSAIEEILTFIERNHSRFLTEAIIAEAINQYQHIAIDPHSDYRLKSEMMAEMVGSNHFVGIGIVQEPVTNGTILLKVIEHSGADRAGLKAGDVIVAAKGKSLVGMKKSEISAWIRGEENSSISFDVLRNKKRFSVSVTRLRLQEQVVATKTFALFQQKIGYIRLKNFMYNPACREISKALEHFNQEHVKGAILDLRGNDGGYVHVTKCLAGLFLGPNKILAYFEEPSRGGQWQYTPNFTEDAQIFNKPLVVLIDSESASGSELLAGALKDYNRALVIGQTSFGKGSMQAAVDETATMVLYSTQGLFFLPSGQTNQTSGIKPHVEVYRHLQPEDNELFPLTERSKHMFPIEPRSIPVPANQVKFNSLQVPKLCIQEKRPQDVYNQAPEKGQLRDLQLTTAAAAIGCL